jgi:hypothetical protein
VELHRLERQLEINFSSAPLLSLRFVGSPFRFAGFHLRSQFGLLLLQFLLIALERITQMARTRRSKTPVNAVAKVELIGQLSSPSRLIIGHMPRVSVESKHGQSSDPR